MAEWAWKKERIGIHYTRPDTRPPVADGWAGAEMRVFPLFDWSVTDRPTDRPMDGQSLLQSCVSATKKDSNGEKNLYLFDII